ncbi:hypothetical protein FQA39_LY17814 [Lamprigera yunnana]|nr:hypothetical protein FQA39_LY17814 [Lamprigera yunnana]
MFNALKPKHFDLFIVTAKTVSKFDVNNDVYETPTFAINVSTTLKRCCDVALNFALKKQDCYIGIDSAEAEADLKNVIRLIDCNWHFEVLNGLNLIKWNKVTIVPLASDLKILKEYLIKVATSNLKNDSDDSYNKLLETVFCRVLLLNKKRPGELRKFCRSCIVQYLDKNKYCPICDVQVHKTKPLLNIRPDKTVQDIVYKLVPRLFQNEMCNRREFYESHPQTRPSNLEQCGEASYQHILSPDESICLSLNYHGSTGPPRYLRCPTAVSIMHLQKLLRSKYDLSNNHRVDILHNQDCLNSHLTLIDIAYIYLWRRKGPLELTYRIYETTNKFKFNAHSVMCEYDDKNSEDNGGSEWKEVQLRISENGEMCFTGIADCVISKYDQKTVVDEKGENNSECMEETKKDIEALKLIGRENTTTTSIQTTIAPIKANTDVVENVKNVTTATVVNCVSKVETNVPSIDAERIAGTKYKLASISHCEPPMKQQKQTILNHSLGIHNLSNNHPLKRHSQVRRSTETSTSIDTKCSVVTSMTVCSVSTTSTAVMALPTTSTFSKAANSKRTYPLNRRQTNLPCYAPKTTYNPVINIPKVQATSANTSKIEQIVITQPPLLTPAPTIINHKMTIKNKTGHPIGYKTLRDPPKTWNPQVSRASLLKSPDPKYSNDLKNVRPAKFFKMRNNIPRYLGNPASGVKPLYQVHNSPEKDKITETPKLEKTEIKKHSIVKIDPKTLKPISEKAPETSSLSNQTDLKINTSSVPIFNPLKLQSSPKSDRKSPKSPHSPKQKSTSPSNKRDKLNLNYTPSNPFIPNLTSPTLSPNQFLYPPGPPSFPSYDPRIMAAYHSLLYGQHTPYPSASLPQNLNIDLNRKSFDVSMTTSPKSPIVSENSVKNETKVSNIKTKRFKESNKNEKSLENTVEKLTQNRVKELTKSDDNDRKEEKVVGNKEKRDLNSESNHSKEVPVKNDLKIKMEVDPGDNKNVSSNNNNNNSDSVSLIADEKKK